MPAGRVQSHRVGEPALVLEPVVAVARQLGDAVPGEQLRRGAVLRRFGGDGLGAVLAELEGGRVVAVGPGAARAVEAVGLVGRQQRLCAVHRYILFDQMFGDVARSEEHTSEIQSLMRPSYVVS